jgi:methionyl-tRNA formyltransferase
MRVIFLGNDPWSVPTLEALAAAEDIDLELVITNPARPAGRGSRPRRTAVAEAAGEIGCAVLEADGVAAGAGRGAIERIRPEAIVVVAYGQLLPAAVLDVPTLGTVNLHFSLLPRWRGAAPVQRAILAGDEVTGVSVMLLDEGLDTGPVLSRVEESIAPDEDAGALGERLASIGAPFVVEALRSLERGTAAPVPQDHAAATVASKLAPGERVIDWGRPAESIVRRVRALAPVPGATTMFRATPLKVLRAEVRERGDTLEAVPHPGELVVDPDGVPVAITPVGGVALLEVAPAGRARMPGAAWARGARIEPGERCS